MRTHEEQAKAAIAKYCSDIAEFKSNSMHFSILHQILCDLLAGKFAEEPMPRIIAPAWGGCTYVEQETGKSHRGYLLYNVLNEVCDAFTGKVRGPSRKTEREAIEAWNAGMKP